MQAPARLPPGAAPRPSPTAPVVVERPRPPAPMDDLRALANVPAPFSVIVWVFSALATGVLTVFQVVMLPLVVHIARQWGRNQPDVRRMRLEDEVRHFEATVQETRRTLAHVASHTHPIRDEPRDGDPDDRRRR